MTTLRSPMLNDQLPSHSGQAIVAAMHRSPLLEKLSLKKPAKEKAATMPWWHGLVRKARFQLSPTAHSGTGEKETLNINVVRK